MSQTKAQLLGPVLGDVNYDSGTLFVDSTNNRVGIGTTTVDERLTVSQGNILIQSTTTVGANLRLQFKPGFSGTYGDQYISAFNAEFRFGMSTVGGTNSCLTIYNQYGTEALRVNSTGNVGIGTTNPAKPLHATGEVQFSINTKTHVTHLFTTGNADDGVYLIKNASNVDRVLLHSNGSSYLNGGNVGIGITNPTYTLHTGGTAAFITTGITTEGPFYVVGNKATAGGAVISIRHDSVTGADDVFGGIKISSAPGADFVIGKNSRLGTGYLQIRREGGTPLLTVDGNGNVGIGTTVPISTLHVQGSFRSLLNSGTGGDTILGAINGVSNGYLINTDTSNNITHTWHTGGNVVALRISNTGNVGIGTSDNSANKVTIYDTMAKQPSSSGWGLVVADSNTDGIAGRGGAIAFGARRTDGGNFNAGAISGAKSNSTGMNENGDLVFWSSVNSTLTERMRVVTGGNVGIATTNPGSTLDVYGNLSVGRTSNQYRYCSISNVGQIVTNIANNGNEYNLVLDNVGDLTSTTNHGSSILYRTSDNNSASAIDSGRLSILKSQQWTPTGSTRNSHFILSLASSGILQDRVKIGGRSGGSQITIFKRDSSPTEDALTGNHQLLFVDPDGDGPAYYRRCIISQYKGINQYSYWAIRYDGASYDYTGSLKCRITWSTSHASGAGFAEFSLAVRSGDSSGGPAPAGNIIQYGPVQYSGGWFYGWTGNPDFDVYYAGFNEDKQFLVLRLSGYMSHNGASYDGGVHETVDLETWGNAFQGLYRIGTTAPSGFTLNAITKTILS